MDCYTGFQSGRLLGESLIHKQNGTPILGGLENNELTSLFLMLPDESPDCVSKKLLRENLKSVEVTYEKIFEEEEGGGGEVIVLDNATISPNGNIKLTFSEYYHDYGGVKYYKTLPDEVLDISTRPIDYGSHRVCDDMIDEPAYIFKTCMIETDDGRFVYDGLSRCIFMYDNNGTYIRAFGRDCDLFNPILFFQHTDGSIIIVNNEEEREGEYSDETLWTRRNMIRFFFN